MRGASRSTAALAAGLALAAAGCGGGGDEGRQSPAAAAGVTLHLVGTRAIEAYRDRAP